MRMTAVRIRTLAGRVAWRLAMAQLSHEPTQVTLGRAVTALTRRQRQVASLVSQGLTNRRIAQRLHVTDKTIEMHLANIFAKLGVSSRTQATAALIRAGKT